MWASGATTGEGGERWERDTVPHFQDVAVFITVLIPGAPESEALVPKFGSLSASTYCLNISLFASAVTFMS